MKIYTESHKSNVTKEKISDAQSEKPRRLNRWSIFLFVIFAAIVTVVYVSNVINIDNLLKNNQNMKRTYQALKDENDILRRKLNFLQAPERITQIASTKLGMIRQEVAPEYIISKTTVKK